MEVSGQLHTQAALFLGKEPTVLIGPQGRSGRFNDERNLLPLTAYKPGTVLSELYRCIAY